MFKAQAGLKKTQKEIRKSILESEQNLQKYKDVIAKFELDFEKKIEEKFEEMHYTAAEETELAPGSSAKKKYRAPTDRSVEYKYAFGQKIPEHYEWKVKQKHDVQLRKNKNLGFYTEPKQKPKFEIVYD